MVRNVGGVEVKLNSKTIGEMLNGDLGIREELMRRANAVLAEARSIAPVDTGAYRDGLRVFATHTDRLAVRVGSDVRHAMIVEASHGVLARAVSGVAK